MTWLLPLLFLFPAEVPKTPVPQQSFEQIARRADESRSADRLAEAITLYKQGITLRPSWSEGWWWLATIYYEQDRFQEARTAFRHFIANSKNPTPAYAFLALCEYETHDYEQASRHFGAWARGGSPGNAQLIDVASFHWALLLTREGRFVQALYMLEEKVKSHGVSPILAEAMGLASLRMKSLPEEYPPERREMVWLAGQASAYGSRHEFEVAHEFAGRLAAHYGQEPEVHYLCGTIYTFEKKNQEAAAEYKQELKISPKHTSAMIQLASIDLDDARLDEAMATVKQAISIEPADPLAHYVLGRVLLASNDLQGSVRELETARQLAPGSAKVHFHLAKAYRRLGRKADADRENALFETLKDKNDAPVSPEVKAKGTPAGKARTQ